MRHTLCVLALVTSLVTGCDEADNLYMFDAKVVKKTYKKGTAEPLHVTLKVSLNGEPEQRVNCRIKNVLKPMWDGLHKGKVVKLTKTSSYEYRPKMFCGLLNDANIKDVIK